jgi:hypothetical protein
MAVLRIFMSLMVMQFIMSQIKQLLFCFNSVGLSPPPSASSLEHRLRDRDIPALSLEQRQRDGGSGLTLSTSTPLFKKKPLGEANSQVVSF